MRSKNIVRRLKSLLRSIELFPFLFTSSDPEGQGFVVVTGADSSHYQSLRQFLSSLFLNEPNIKVIAFDLGLADEERRELKRAFQTIEVRIFNFSKYPNYFDIKVNAGEYAWKPVIVADVLNEFRCCVCWMDAGNIITKPLLWIRRIVNLKGMYSPISHGVISDWTHPKTLQALRVPNKLFHKRNLSSGCVAVNYQNVKARTVVDRWRNCAFRKEYIAPEGSNRTNHRQDQALLSVIAHQAGITKGMPKGRYGVRFHQDID